MRIFNLALRISAALGRLRSTANMSPRPCSRLPSAKAPGIGGGVGFIAAYDSGLIITA